MFASTIASSASSTAISSELGLAFAANVVAGCASAVGDDVRNSRPALARGALVDAPTPHRSSALGGACTVAARPRLESSRARRRAAATARIGLLAAPPPDATVTRGRRMGRRRRARGVGARVAAIALAAVLACVGADAREAIARASLGANGAIEATLSQRYERAT